jgi:hypothetical protein
MFNGRENPKHICVVIFCDIVQGEEDIAWCIHNQTKGHYTQTNYWTDEEIQRMLCDVYLSAVNTWRG